MLQTLQYPLVVRQSMAMLSEAYSPKHEKSNNQISHEQNPEYIDFKFAE